LCAIIRHPPFLNDESGKKFSSYIQVNTVYGRYVANVVISTLFAERPGEVFLLVSEVLDRRNHSMIAVLFDNAMKLLWPGEVRMLS
jgi:hypothetical protein